MPPTRPWEVAAAVKRRARGCSSPAARTIHPNDRRRLVLSEDGLDIHVAAVRQSLRSSPIARSMNVWSSGLNGARWPQIVGMTRNSAPGMVRASYSLSTGGK